MNAERQRSRRLPQYYLHGDRTREGVFDHRGDAFIAEADFNCTRADGYRRLARGLAYWQTSLRSREWSRPPCTSNALVERIFGAAAAIGPDQLIKQVKRFAALLEAVERRRQTVEDGEREVRGLVRLTELRHGGHARRELAARRRRLEQDRAALADAEATLHAAFPAFRRRP